MRNFCAVLLLLVLPAPGLHSQQTGSPGRDSTKADRFTFDACVNRFTISRVESTKAGYQYWFVDRNFLDGRTLKMSAVKPHAATHLPHRHPEDEIFFVLEGTAEVFLNGEKTLLQPYASLYCPPNSDHGIRNAGDTELKYLVIKTYPGK
jgi:mannose-6-phosphate isomerase-like protein (cupin superfamily)